MRFLFLIHGDAAAEAALTPAERRAIVGEHLRYADGLRERGAYVLGEALAGADTAAVVRPGGKPLVTDGPYAETKEALTGFFLLECADLDEAIRHAARIPAAWNGAVEVRPVPDLTAMAPSE